MPRRCNAQKRSEKKAERVRFHISLETIVFLTCTTYFDTAKNKPNSKMITSKHLTNFSNPDHLEVHKLCWKLNAASSERTKKIDRK